MAKRKSKRHRLRKNLRQDFAQIMYSQQLYSPYKVKVHKRMFPSSEHAICHLTNVKLKLVEEDSPWNKFTPTKILAGYRHRGKKVVTYTKVIEQEPKNEYPSMGWDQSSGRQFRQHWRSSIPVPKGVGSPIYQWAKSNVGGSGWPSTNSSSTTTVDGTGLQSYNLPDTAWDKLPFSALV